VLSAQSLISSSQDIFSESIGIFHGQGENVMTATRLLAVSALMEAAIGLALMIAPDAVVQLLLGSPLGGAGIPLGRVAGIALLCLGIACWPSSNISGDKSPALMALAIYNLLVAAYLAYVGISGEFVGPLLWPVVALHAVIGAVLAFAWLQADRVTA
jgi:hypothetical protein